MPQSGKYYFFLSKIITYRHIYIYIYFLNFLSFNLYAIFELCFTCCNVCAIHSSEKKTGGKNGRDFAVKCTALRTVRAPYHNNDKGD